MSHVLSSELSPIELVSLERHVEYVEAHLDEIIANVMADDSIPYWHRELLADHFRDYRSQVEGAITWDEFEKELDKIIYQD
jgi:hypothetical protein